MRTLLILAAMVSAAHAADAPLPRPQPGVQEPRVNPFKSDLRDVNKGDHFITQGAQPLTPTHVPNYLWWLQNGKKR